MPATMMEFPLTLTHIFERASRLFSRSEIVSRMPDVFEFMPEIPCTSTGKMLKAKLREQFGGLSPTGR